MDTLRWCTERFIWEELRSHETVEEGFDEEFGQKRAQRAIGKSTWRREPIDAYRKHTSGSCETTFLSLFLWKIKWAHKI